MPTHNLPLLQDGAAASKPPIGVMFLAQTSACTGAWSKLNGQSLARDRAPNAWPITEHVGHIPQFTDGFWVSPRWLPSVAWVPTALLKEWAKQCMGQHLLTSAVQCV